MNGKNNSTSEQGNEVKANRPLNQCTNEISQQSPCEVDTVISLCTLSNFIMITLYKIKSHEHRKFHIFYEVYRTKGHVSKQHG